MYQAHPVTVDAFARHRISRRTRVRHAALMGIQVALMTAGLFAFYMALVIVGPSA